MLCLSNVVMAQQEEESAELTLEEYSDAFQESFFEALKQKGIENYEKAIDLFLECKKIDKETPALDFEIGKSFLALRKYDQAEGYLFTAVQKSPDNQWYLFELYRSYFFQHKNDKALQTVKKLVAIDEQYNEELINLYVNVKDYDKALALIDEIDNKKGKSTQRDSLRRRITWMKADQESNEAANKQVEVVKKKNPLDLMREELEAIEAAGDHTALFLRADKALGQYPSQPFLYLFKGRALNKSQQFQRAIYALESGLDYIIDDPKTESQIYLELSNAYTGLNNLKKAKEYLKKSQTIQ